MIESIVETEKMFRSINPATGEVIGSTKKNSIEELLDAVKSAKAAQKLWAAKSFSERAKHLFTIRDYLVAHADEISEIISKDSGKTRVDAISTEVLSSAMAITYYAKNAESVLQRKKLSGGSILTINKRSYVDRVPYGVIGIISPWNYPFAIPFHEVAMALITGNAVILKTATQTLEVGKALKACIDAGNLPHGLFHFLNIPGNIAGDAFIESGIDKLFFTGSVPVGKQLMKKASEKLLPISLELGGNDAMIVCDDANIYRAVSGAIWAGYSNAGQSCAGVERIYVDEKIYDSFVTLLKKKLSEMNIGADTNFNVAVGSLTTEKQLETVKKHVADAREKGATIFTANNTASEQKGLFHPLTVIEDATNEMLVQREETFGPVVTATKFHSVEEAIKLANDSSLGLTASVWTKNKTKAHRIAAQLEVGSVMINDHLMSHGLAETPWGGWKESGYGRTHGYLGLEAMTQPRVVIDDIIPGLQKNMWWHPHSKQVYDGLKGGMHFLYSKNLSLRFTGMINLVKVFLRSFRRN
ncbi:MAG: aldehyde dehydrogenase family protein [Ignavibacteria bacterium]|nr:aldehyde dehydrogenase family protein [Ignavibacteria bacterium]